MALMMALLKEIMYDEIASVTNAVSEYRLIF